MPFVNNRNCVLVHFVPLSYVDRITSSYRMQLSVAYVWQVAALIIFPYSGNTRLRSCWSAVFVRSQNRRKVVALKRQILKPNKADELDFIDCSSHAHRQRPLFSRKAEVNPAFWTFISRLGITASPTQSMLSFFRNFGNVSCDVFC